jgi:mycoketide-CoA synthase
VPARLNLAALRNHPDPTQLAAPLRALADGPRRVTATAAPSGSWLERLNDLPDTERHEALVQLIRTEAAAVLGHDDLSGIEPDRAFKEVGFDSLTAVEFRNRLRTALALRLPPSLVFDYPTPAALGQHLAEALAPAPEDITQRVIEDLMKLEQRTLSDPLDDESRRDIATRLKDFLRKLSGEDEAERSDTDISSMIESASDDEMFAFIENEL